MAEAQRMAAEFDPVASAAAGVFDPNRKDTWDNPPVNTAGQREKTINMRDDSILKSMF
jgi:hypothetical protein